MTRPRARILWLIALLALVAFSNWGWRATHPTKPSTGTAAAVPACSIPAIDPSARYPGMVWVPAGQFDMGDTKYPEEGPIRPTRVDGFWMDRTEVRNDEFAAFVQATGYVTVAERAWDAQQQPNLAPELRAPGAVVFAMPTKLHNRNDLQQWWQYVAGAQWRHPGGPSTDIQGRGHFPVVTVTYEDALAYATWKGRSLPTESQWEWAARAGEVKAAKDHDQPHGANTWQGVFPVLNSADDGFVGLAPVGCYTPNAWGLYDMMGNVWEMTRDLYTPDHSAVASPKAENSPDSTLIRNASARQRVIKGGSFLCSPDYCMRYRSGSRQPQEEDLGTSHLGFRTVLLAPGP
jgi:formylglycine-generating enzyme required for sulfatase activity